MRTISVWAPLPRRIEVEVDGQRHGMTSQPDGWWVGKVPARLGNDYAFYVDGAGPFPDPRSAWQPDGVHRHSRLVNHSAFNWTDEHFTARPLSEAVVYELHVGTFTPEGTFDAAISRLPHLVTLGITHVGLMPVNAFPGVHGWGYDGVSLYAVHEPYGGPEGMKRFVNAAHNHGLAVVLDVIYNHLGPSGNYLGKFGPYFNSRYATPWGAAVNFDAAYSDEVRRFFIDNARMWLRDYHCDGLRLDAVHSILDTTAVPFLEQLATEVDRLSNQLGRPLALIPESDLNDPRLLWPRERGGVGLNAQWSDDFHHVLHVALTGERVGYYEDFASLADLAKALRNGYVYDGRYSRHRRRHHGRPHGGLSGHNFLGYLQNHDQVGNRACGERIGHLVEPARAKLGAALVLTSPFVPMLFMGEEWGASTPFQYFTDHQEPELARAVSEGRRKEFASFGSKPSEVPDPQAPQTFARSKLNWAELKDPKHADWLQWYRALIQLRAQEPALRDGRLDLVKTYHDETARWLVMERGPITVACNFNEAPQRITLRTGEHTTLLANTDMPPKPSGSVSLPAHGVAILRL